MRYPFLFLLFFLPVLALSEADDTVWHFKEGETYDFSKRPLGFEARKTFTIENTGRGLIADLQVATDFSSSNFSMEWGTCQMGGSIRNNESCTIVVVFDPSSDADYSDRIILTARRIEHNITLTVEGSGQSIETKGTVDTSFGGSSNGIAKQDTGSKSEVLTSVTPIDGDELIGVGLSSRDFSISKFKADGSPDTDFNGTGNNKIDFGNSADVVLSVLRGQDDSYLMAGSSDTSFAFARVTSDGSLDTTFSGTGKKLVNIATMAGLNLGEEVSSDFCYGAKLQADGKSVSIGNTMWNSTYRLAVIRLNANGTPDTSFNSTGAQISSFGTGSTFGRAVAIQNDGKIVVVGAAQETGLDFLVVRYNTDGTLDTGFNSTGSILVDFGNYNDLATDVIVQSDGKILVVGRSMTTLGSQNRSALSAIRLDSSGNLDATFGSGGKYRNAWAAGDNILASVQQRDTGEYVIAWFRAPEGQSSSIKITTLKSDGTLETSFGTSGTLTTSIKSSYGTKPGLTLQADGKVLVGGTVITSGDSDFGLERTW